jgi:hypothetical protein
VQRYHGQRLTGSFRAFPVALALRLRLVVVDRGSIEMHILGIVVLGAALSTQSESVRSEGVNFGVGGHMCATFAKLRAKSPDAEPLFFTWAEGFLTAWNMASEKQILKVDTRLRPAQIFGGLL